MNDWLTLLGTLGGFEAIRWSITFWVNRKTNARKEDATVDAIEEENERKHVTWLEDRIAQRDAKIDALYIELREEQASKLDEIHKRHEVELKLKDAENKRCDIVACSTRQPPSDY